MIRLIELNISNCKLVVDFLNTVSKSHHPYIISVKSEIFEALMPLLAVAVHMLPFTKRPHGMMLTTDSADTQTNRDDSSDVDDMISPKDISSNTADEPEVYDSALGIKDLSEALVTAHELGLKQDIACLLENLVIHLEKHMPKDFHNFSGASGFLAQLLDILTEKDAASVDLIYQSFFHAVFHVYWHRYVGNVPPEPNWSRKPVSCSLNCSDCIEVNEFLADPRTRHYGLSAGEKRRDHIHSRIEGKPDSLRRYLCSTVEDGYKKERLQIWKKDPRWTEAKQAQEQRKKNFTTLLSSLKSFTLRGLIGGTMTEKSPKVTARRSVVDIIESARDLRAAESIANAQIALHEEPEDAGEDPTLPQQLAPVAQMIPFAPALATSESQM